MKKNVQSFSRARIASFACLSALALLLVACQKSDLGPTTAERLKSAEQRQQTVPDFYVPRKTVDYMSDLKAIKEITPPAEPPKKDANTKDVLAKDSAAKTAAIETKGTSGKAGAAVAAAPANAATAAAGSATGAATAVVAAPVAVAPVPKTPEPVATPAPAPVVVATAAPTSRPAPTQDVSPIVSVVAREQPEFPRDAARQGVESGAVRARLTINAAGDVTNVAIVQARPLRVFDRSVTTALSRWKFNPGAEGRTYDTEVAFQR